MIFNDIEIFEHNTDNEAFKIPNFGCFNYEPENIGYDSEEILSYLQPKLKNAANKKEAISIVEDELQNIKNTSIFTNSML